MTSPISFKSLFFTILVFATTMFSAQAQEESITLNSRVAIVATETKTNIWVSDFPKGTSVVIFDEENNLLSVVSTNQYGAAYVSLPKSITTTIFAKTMNGEINVSNRATKTNNQEPNVASNADGAGNSTKA